MVLARSACADCARPLTPPDLAPIASFLLLCGPVPWMRRLYPTLPDAITMPLLLAGLASTAWLDPAASTSHAAAAAWGDILVRAVAFRYPTLRQREGLGQGDAKLVAAGDAWVGLAGLPWVVLAGSAITLAGAPMAALSGTGDDPIRRRLLARA
ncbi:MAG: prepilin peptidase [Acetobacteraceae bacterium]|nr:prepilin peptidase [Acetobacteraceae bacterium]MBV8521932.1 prepilin peptidase [Acetobacteraceae bacterium]